MYVYMYVAELYMYVYMYVAELQSALLRLEKVKRTDFFAKKHFIYNFFCEKKQDKRTLKKVIFPGLSVIGQNSWNEGSLKSGIPETRGQHPLNKQIKIQMQIRWVG